MAETPEQAEPKTAVETVVPAAPLAGGGRPTPRSLLALFETLPLGVVYRDAQGQITAANPAAQRLLGRTLDQMVGRTSVHPRWRVLREDGTELTAGEGPSAAALRTGRPVRDMIVGVYDPDAGSTRWLRVSATPEFREGEDRPHQVYSIFEDVTAARQAEAALEQSERLRRAALAGAPLVLWAMDAGGLITLAEGSGLARAGTTPADYVGRSVFALSDNAILRAAWRRALAGEDASYDTANGGVLFHNELRPQRDSAGAVVGVIGVAFDVTEREVAAAARREAAQRQGALLRDVLASVTGGRLRLVEAESDLPAPLRPAGAAIALTRDAGLRELREMVQEAAGGLGFPTERWQDLVTAASEAGMNAIVHGGGRGEVVVSTDGSARVQVRVRDWGAGISAQDLPRAALRRGWSSTTSLGHGLAMMLESVDRLWLLTGAGGTTLVLEQGRAEPLPAWLESA